MNDGRTYDLSIQRREVTRAVDDPYDLNRGDMGAINDQVRMYQPEAVTRVGKVQPQMPDAGKLDEPVHLLLQRITHPVSSVDAGLGEIVPDFEQILLGLPRQQELVHDGRLRRSSLRCRNLLNASAPSTSSPR